MRSAAPAEPSIGYVVKGYPRLSELFIASEMHRLERAGLRLRLFVIKRGDEAFHHPIVDRIDAQPEYLPATASVSGTPLWQWLRIHLPLFARALARTIARWPLGVAHAAIAAAAQAARARETFWSAPRKVYAKEFLQAVAIADALRDAPDVRHLHAHFCHGAATVTWLAAMMSERSFSFTAHAKDIYTPSANPAGLLARKLAAARFAVTCTEANRIYLQQFAGRTPVYRVYHGLNAEFADILRRELDAGRRAADARVLRVVGVGRHVRKKGFDVLVDACADLVARKIAVDAVIIGEPGDETDALADRIARRGLRGQVRLAGPMSQQELLDEYRRATVFCLPCRVNDDGDRDGIPNVLMEAMASGVPIVTTNVSGIPELLEHDRSGLLVRPDDAAATADALLRVFTDRALAERLAARGRAVVAERFDGDRLIGDLLTLFERVA